MLSSISDIIAVINAATVAKLLMGIYDSDMGIAETYNHEISAVFQDFYKYKMSLSENIKIADLKININLSEFMQFMEENGLTDDIFKNNISTQLGREFGGIDLSGGEWQRLAIARCFYRKSKFAVLDEPTASIDPIEENEILEIIRRGIINKKILFITHRMSMVKMADVIVVMKNGSIIEEGSFDELMKTDSYFKKLYEMQSAWYGID